MTLTTPSSPAIPSSEIAVRGFVEVLVDLLRDAATGVESAPFKRVVSPWRGRSSAPGRTLGYCGALELSMRQAVDAGGDHALDQTLAGGLTLAGDLRSSLAHLHLPWYPDFLWHVPGTLASRLVVEVRSCRVRARDLRTDVQHLRQFIGQGHGDVGAVLVLVGPQAPSTVCWAILDQAVADGVIVLIQRRAGQRPQRL